MADDAAPPGSNGVVGDAGSCSICLEEFQPSTVTTTLPCGHTFCSVCLDGWRSRYDLVRSGERGCPQCRRRIPPSRAMLSQIQTNRKVRGVIQEILDNPPYWVPPPSEDGGRATGRDGLIVDLLSGGYLPLIRSIRDPELQQRSLKQTYATLLRDYDTKILEWEGILGDYDPSDLIDDAGGMMCEDLPEDVFNAALEDDVDRILEWLGGPPVPPGRINARNRSHMDRTLLHEAEFSGNLGLLAILLQLGAEVDPKNTFGKTPLFQTCFHPHLFEVARVLLQWGADKHSTAPSDMFPSGTASTLDIAKMNGNTKLLRLLRSPLGGRRCEIVGLQRRTDLNGLTCVVDRYLGDAVDQYVVKVETTKEPLKVKTVNLRRFDRTPASPGCLMKYMGKDPETGSSIYHPVVALPFRSS
jgi:hypothetical protein